MRRARETGFSDAEVADAISSFTFALDNTPVSNQIWADSLVRSAKFGVPSFYDADQSVIFDPAVMTTEAVNAAWQSIVTTPNQIAMILWPKESNSRNDGNTWNNEKLTAMIAAVEAETLQATVAYVEKPLLAKEPKRGKVVNTKTENGATVWTLNNGAQVLLRQQRQADEQIGVHVRFAGGALSLPKEFQSVAMVLPKYMMLAGVGELNAAELNHLLRKEVLEFKPIFETAQHGFGGVAAERSLQAWMQLLYLSMVQPRSDNSANETAALQAYQSYMQNGPDINLNLFGDAWPYRPWYILNDYEVGTEKLDQLREQLYGNPAQLRIVLTGVAHIAKAKDLVERYIASIPKAKAGALTLLPNKIEPKTQALSSTVLSERLKESLNTFTHAN
ncbi:MAG: hypothetical protein ACRC01_03215, partial [Deefgea sp.]